jgi:hypothetical protein
MTEIISKLRWFPLGPIEGPLETIKKDDLDRIAKNHGVNISLEETRGAVLGETRGKAIEEITQWMVTISTDDEEAFKGAVRALVKKYRAPRTTYATLGSDEKTRRMVEELFDEEDGWL